MCLIIGQGITPYSKGQYWASDKVTIGNIFNFLVYDEVINLFSRRENKPLQFYFGDFPCWGLGKKKKKN